MSVTGTGPLDARPGDIDRLRSTRTIREQAQALLARARAGHSAHFLVDEAGLEAAAALVAEVTRERYPDLAIPFHSRWRHFEAGGIDRKTWLDEALGTADTAVRARAQFDLVLVSVLLDAGAGASWHYRETRTGQVFSRSEGLGVASFHAFMDGLFSSSNTEPLRCDATALSRLDEETLSRSFQVGPDNPLVGLAGRADLLRRLGQAMARQPEVFGSPGRPGGLFDRLRARADLRGQDVLRLLLDTLSEIWPSGQRFQGVPVGDCWPCAALGASHDATGWMPFHKLSQWLSYSLLEPLQWAAVRVDGLDDLTGLPEYRNGGLLLDSGALRLREPAQAQQLHVPADAFIIEWRALTVALLDELAPRVRSLLGRSEAQMPLACVLEGGTWAAGRVLAQRLRQGLPPLRIDSDGTVF